MLLLGYKFLKFLFRYVVPRPLRYPLAKGIAYGVCLLNRRRRRVLIENLTPLVGEKQARAIAPVLLGNYLMTAIDFFCTRPNRPRPIVMVGGSRIKAAYEANRRVIIMTAHIGNWETGISYLMERGYPIAGLYAVYTHDEIVQWITSHRNPHVQWIPATPGAAAICVAAVEQGKMLCLAADIPYGEHGRRTTIAGHTARLPIGPWTIAIRAQATVLPAFVLRDSPGHYLAHIEEPIRAADRGNVKQQIARMQDTYRAHLEHYLKTYPEQWGNLNPFWDDEQTSAR